MKLPIDIKVSKLNPEHTEHKEKLVKWLMENQGFERKSLENRIFIIMRNSIDSRTEFFEYNRKLIVNKCLDMFSNVTNSEYFYPIKIQGKLYLCWLIEIYNWVSINGEPQEFKQGKGLRDKSKAEWERELSKELESKSNGIWIHNKNSYEHGIDGYIKFPYEELRRLKNIE